MLRTPSVFGPLNSGFVPFSSGAAMDAPVESDPACEADASLEAEAGAAAAIARAAAPMLPMVEHQPGAAWAPASSARIRIVEALVVAAICAYFGLGLVRMFAGA